MTHPDTIALANQLRQKADELRIHSIRATTEAGSGHPSSCCSAADIVATLFFSVMRYDPQNPRNPNNDRFVLSKGHAAPLLYAAWAEAGLFDPQDLLKLRTLESDLEGHPTPRLSFVDMATGSLGQGLSVGVGIALNHKYLDKIPARTYVVLGDGESVEGSIWEAAEIARHYQLDNLCGILDINRLGQSDPTMLQHDLKGYQARWEGFGWHTICVDGHNHRELLQAFGEAASTAGKPTMILAKTLKGKGVPFSEDHPNWHGKPLNAQQAEEAIAHLTTSRSTSATTLSIATPSRTERPSPKVSPLPAPPYKATDSVATREAFGDGLLKLGEVNPLVVGLDADVKNSTYTEKFGKRFPERFFENFIAEQNMVGAAAGLAACGKIPFAATFACFLTRAYDFIRMAAISQSNLKLMGSHVGVSIGEDGPSQMGLEDIAMMAAQPGIVVLYPSDAVCAYKLVETMANHTGMVYMRTGRPKTPLLYGPEETFSIGGSKVLRQSDQDQLTLVGAGITVFEALKAYDQLKATGISVRVIDLYSIAPIDVATLREAVRATNHRILTVEDHYLHGGIGDAVLNALADEGVRAHKMGIQQIPHSGKPDQLVDHYGISARAITEKIRQILKK